MLWSDCCQNNRVVIILLSKLSNLRQDSCQNCKICDKNVVKIKKYCDKIFVKIINIVIILLSKLWILWSDCCQITNIVIRLLYKLNNIATILLSKLKTLWSYCCQNYKFVIRFLSKLEALHHGQCEGTIKVTGFCSFSNKSQSFLVRNNFAASSATNPNKFLVTDKHFHNVRHLYDKETDRHIKKSNKSTPISHSFTIAHLWF